MRITGGILGGRRITVPGTRVRPTQDKVRGAVFSALASRITGARVLDLFAGTGAMGLEAFSRGAAFVCWVESEPRVFLSLRKNVEELCGDDDGRVRVVRSEVMRFLRKQEGSAHNIPFDIVFADPPYDVGDILLKKILYALSRMSILKTGGLLIAEQDARGVSADCAGWSLDWDRKYGETRVCFFSKHDYERMEP